MEPKDKKEYEIAYLARTEEDAQGIVGLVKAQGIEARDERVAGRIRLAYEIKKEKEAFFGSLVAMMDADIAKQLEATLRMDNRVLRSMIILTPKRSERPMGMGERPEMRPSRPSEPRAVPLSNEALEKKIEEILQ